MWIKLDNIVDNDDFPHRVIVVSGSLANNQRSFIEVTLNNEYQQICPVVQSKFKVILTLQKGENVIKFQGGDYSQSLRVFFRPRRNNFGVFVLIYIVYRNSDGTFQAPQGSNCDIESACQRISVAASLMQTFISQSLR